MDFDRYCARFVGSGKADDAISGDEEQNDVVHLDDYRESGSATEVAAAA